MNNKDARIDIQKKERTTWIWIKQRLALLGSSFAALARLHNVAQQNVTMAAHRTYPKYERLIAESIGLDPWELWPERYDAAHNPIRISSRYQGHKHFLNNTPNKLKSNGKDNQKTKTLTSRVEPLND